MIPLPRVLLRLSAALCVLGALSACAIQSNSKGGYSFGVDTAALFGTEIAQFTLQNGSEGTLRREGNKYSVKLSRYQRVIALPNAESARIARVENIGARTVVVIETQKRGCDYRYTVLAIETTDVLSWELGNCKDRPIALVADDRSAMAFDFPKGAKIERFVYTQDGRMLRRIEAPAAGVNPRAKPFADEALYPPGYLEALRQHGTYPPPAEPAAPAGKPGKSGKPGKGPKPAAEPPARTTPAAPAPSSPTPAGSQASGRVVPPPPQRVPGADAPADTAARPAPRTGGVSRVPTKLDLPEEEITSTRLDLRD